MSPPFGKNRSIVLNIYLSIHWSVVCYPSTVYETECILALKHIVVCRSRKPWVVRHRKINKIILGRAMTPGTNTCTAKSFHVLLRCGLHTIKLTPRMCSVEWVLVVTERYSHHHGPTVEILFPSWPPSWPLEVILPFLLPVPYPSLLKSLIYFVDLWI